MNQIVHLFERFFDGGILLYATILVSFYIVLAIISAFALRRYLKKGRFIDYDQIVSSPFAPSVSILAPAYNESLTIESNIRALLSLYYHNFEVIIINDGSTDDSLEKIIKTYDLEKVDFAVHYSIPCKEIKAVYKSRNKAFANLVVVDKVNGGKADALNAGINIAQNDYFVSIDVDSIVEPDALLKLVKPFLDETNRKVIATGGVVRIANSCVVEGGRILDVRAPKNLFARFQTLEYMRAFLMGRMAWSKLNGLLLISGAIGMFDRKIVIACGGYFAETVGEDMELVVRMRRYMTEQKKEYVIAYVPDPLLWTEVPESASVLGRQRNRWTRGTIDTIFLHKKLFFNPKYGLMGMLSFPYWVFFEWLAPLIQIFGLVYTVLLLIFNEPNWHFYFYMLILIYAFAVTFSTYAILFEELTFHRYKKKRDVLRIFLVAWLEPFFYNPMLVWFALKGNWDYFVLKKSGWGKMQRKGFSGKTKISV